MRKYLLGQLARIFLDPDLHTVLVDPLIDLLAHGVHRSDQYVQLLILCDALLGVFHPCLGSFQVLELRLKLLLEACLLGLGWIRVGQGSLELIQLLRDRLLLQCEGLNLLKQCLGLLVCGVRFNELNFNGLNGLLVLLNHPLFQGLDFLEQFGILTGWILSLRLVRGCRGR